MLSFFFKTEHDKTNKKTVLWILVSDMKFDKCIYQCEKMFVHSFCVRYLIILAAMEFVFDFV